MLGKKTVQVVFLWSLWFWKLSLNTCPLATLDKTISNSLTIKLKPPSIFTRNIYINFLQHYTLHLGQLLLSTEKWNCSISRTGDKAGTRAEYHQLLSPGRRAGEKREGMRNQGRHSMGSLPNTGLCCSCCTSIHLAAWRRLYCSESWCIQVRAPWHRPKGQARCLPPPAQTDIDRVVLL